MYEINIYLSEDSAECDSKAIDEGYRNDVFVNVSNKLFQINVYSIARLQQEFIKEKTEYGFYSIEPNLVVVKEVSKDQIRRTIEGLFYQRFFEYINPIEEQTSINNLFEI